MARVVSTGRQDFALMMKNKNFYVDKTKFIEEWWNDDKDVTLVTRPRRFGKTLMMSTVNCFFSNRYAGRKDLFKGLYIRKRRKMMELQGTYPVVFLSFSDCKDSEDVNGRSIKGYNDMVRAIKEEISDLYGEFPEILGSDGISEAEKRKFVRIRDFEDEKQFTTAMMTDSIQFLCKLISRVSDNKPIIILNEYDTPLQEAYTSGYWPRLVKTMRAFFNKSFKTTKHFEKALVTGITRVSKESLFSDVNNFNTYSVTSDRYADCFGFTEQEVFDSLDEYGLSEKKRQVKNWYDGFVFGNLREIYNPYSIASLLNEKKFKTYWADTSSNALVSQLIRYGADGTRDDFLQLMKGDAIRCVINENVVYGTLYEQPGAIWSLLLGSGYLKAEEVIWPGENDADLDKPIYTLSITNRETRIMFKDMVNAWFTTGTKGKSYDRFIEALLAYNIKDMNAGGGNFSATYRLGKVFFVNAAVGGFGGSLKFSCDEDADCNDIVTFTNREKEKTYSINGSDDYNDWLRTSEGQKSYSFMNFQERILVGIDANLGKYVILGVAGGIQAYQGGSDYDEIREELGDLGYIDNSDAKNGIAPTSAWWIGIRFGKNGKFGNFTLEFVDVYKGTIGDWVGARKYTYAHPTGFFLGVT